MGKLNIYENLFLEVAELKRFQEFIKTNGWQRALRSIVKKYGIVENSSANSFRPIAHPMQANTVRIYPGLAYTPDMEAIYSSEPIDIFYGAIEETKWIVLSRAISHAEIGTVSIGVDGSLIGTGTRFTEVLRGQPNFPTKIHFLDSQNNIYDYEVVNVTSDTSATLSGSFVAESGLRYAVVGTFTPGFIPEAENKYIYEYDSCSIRLVSSSARPEVQDGEFIIGYIAASGVSNFSVFDTRSSCMFSVTDDADPDVYDETGTVTNAADKGYNPCVSLLEVRQVGGFIYGSKTVDLEFVFETGLKVDSFEVSQSENGNFFTMKSISCNAFNVSPNEIADGTFKGWRLVNRANMRTVLISEQNGAVLTLPSVDLGNFVAASGNDFVVVPDFAFVELIVAPNGAIGTYSLPIQKLVTYHTIGCRVPVTLDLPSRGTNAPNTVGINLQYRMQGNNKGGIRYQSNTATYKDSLNGSIMKTAANGYITINLAALEPKQPAKDYS